MTAAYEGIDFKPPKSVADAAAKGLEYRRKANPSSRGGLTPAEAGKQGIGSGVQRAVNLKNRDNVSPDVIRQMVAFFARHEKNKGVSAENKATPWNDKGHVAWLLWGGDPGKAWAGKIMDRMDAADEKVKKTARRMWERPQDGYWVRALDEQGRELSRNWLDSFKDAEIAASRMSVSDGVRRVVIMDRTNMPLKAFTKGRHIASPRRVVNAHLKKACIIAVGDWGGKKCLLKNRDRNYTPEIKLYHVLINGIEVLYMKDEVTGWCEGLNEHGIGIVNAALAVAADEKQGKAGKGKATDAMSEATLRDGKRVLKALGCSDIREATQVLQTHLGGLRGHTFIANKDETFSLEATWRGHDFHQRRLPDGRKHVRTNHGIFYQDAGYTEKDGDNYLSSLARRDQAMKELRKVDAPDGIAPAIYGKRRPELSDPLNMVKLTDGMRTTSQMVLNLDDLVVNLYLLPDQVVYLGYENKLPKKHKPKIGIQVREYTDIDGDGEFDVVEVVLDKPRGKKTRPDADEE